MKKNLIYLAAAAIGLMSFASCNKEEALPEGVLTEPEQQARVEQTFENLMAAVPAEEFTTLSMDIVRFIDQYLISNFSFAEAGGILSDISDNIFVSEDDVENLKDITTFTLMLSDYYGTMDLDRETGKAVYTPDFEKDMLELTFKLGQGETEDSFRATFKQIGAKKNVNLGTYLGSGRVEVRIPKETPSTDPNADNYDSIYPLCQSELNIMLNLPEKMEIVLEKNGQNYASIELIPNFNVSEGGIDFKHDVFDLKININVNGYTLSSKETYVNYAAERISGGVSLSKGAQELLSLSMNAEVGFDKVIENESYFNDKLQKDVSYVIETIIPTKLKDMNFNLKLMNDLEIRSTCTNAVQAASIIVPAFLVPIIADATNSSTEDIWDDIVWHYGPDVPIVNQSDLLVTFGRPVFLGQDKYLMAEWTRKINALNHFISSKLYFAGNENVQATFSLAPKMNPLSFDLYDGLVGTLSATPIISYPDGTVLRVLEWAAGFDFVDLLLYGNSWAEFIYGLADNDLDTLPINPKPDRN